MDFAAAMFAQMMMGSRMGTPMAAAAAARKPRTPAERAADRQRLLSRHDQQLRNLTSQYGTPGMSTLHTTYSGDVKSADDFPAPPPLERCTAITVSELEPGVTHRGRVLRGRLITKPLLMTALSTIMEDENGDAVLLSVYNMIPGNLRGMPGMVAGARALPEGRPVAILEPYYKIMADGSLGIRVDNPREVVLLDSLAPADAATLKEDGRRHFEAAEYDAAVSCYSRALLRMPDAGGAGTELLVTCLNNLSVALLKLGDPAAALQCAAAATAVQPEGSKAHYRTAQAAVHLGPSLALAARASLHRASACMPGGGPSALEWRKMLDEVGPLPQASTAPSAKQAAQGRVDLLRALAGTPPSALLVLLQPPPLPTLKEGDPSAAISTTPDADASAAIAAAAVAKEAGNAAFKSGDYKSAREQYSEAVQTLAAALPAAILLANSAACHLQLSNRKRAVAAATAAALLDPTNSKAHHRRAQALLQLGWLVEAEAACEAGLAAVPPEEAEGIAALAALQKRIRTAKAAEAAAAPGPASHLPGGGAAAAAAVVTEREIEAMRAPVGLPEQTALLNIMTGLAAKDPQRSAAIKKENPLLWRSMQREDRVPPFHDEYVKAGRWLPGCDLAECRRRLWDAYELCLAMPMHLYAMAHSSGSDPLEVLTKRVGVLEPRVATQRLHWLTQASDGDVSFRADAFGFGEVVRGGYNPTIFHSFSNAPAPAIPMPPPPPPPAATAATAADAPGTDGDGSGSSDSSSSDDVIRTHVAVGFVDLGTLAAAVNLPEWDEQVEAAEQELEEAAADDEVIDVEGGGRTTPTTRPLLRWVGFEVSPYAVAKTLVVERMLRAGGPAAADLALQVWYSAAWTRAAHDAFRQALTDLLAEHQRATAAAKTTKTSAKVSRGGGDRGDSGDTAVSDLPAAILSYLRHWQLHDVALVDSRRRWLADWKRTLCVIGHFRDKCDRLALAEYMLTGQLPGLYGSQLVGSVVMFANPPRSQGGAERAMDECFLEALVPEELLAARKQQQQQKQKQKPTEGQTGTGKGEVAGAAAPRASPLTAGFLSNSGGQAASRSKKNKKNKKKGGKSTGGGQAAGNGSSSTGGPGAVGGGSGSSSSTGQQKVDIVAAGVELLRWRLRRLGSLLATGRVEVQVRLQMVAPGDITVAATISSLRPASISWSNVPDYYSPAAFHALAKACSAARPVRHSSAAAGADGAGAATLAAGTTTTHYVTSMNWVMDVKGACHLDVLMPYQQQDDGEWEEEEEGFGAHGAGGRRQRGGRGAGGRGSGRLGDGGGSSGKRPAPPAALTDLILKLTEEGEHLVQRQLAQYDSGDGGGLVFVPPVDNPRNVVDFALMDRHYQAWVDAFLRAGGVRQPRPPPSSLPQSARPPRPEIISRPVYSPLSRTNSTISLAYSYDNR